MGKGSKIEWCSHTFNVVWGCQKVSDACQFCYAETMAKRYGHQVWGPPSTTPRRTLSEAYWRQPLKWNAAAANAGERARVFCSSMADVFEDHPTVDQERQKLWPLIVATPCLDWLLLTKRPENIMSMVPVGWLDGFPRNVWAGTTVESQEYADKRIPELLRVPAAVRFLSCEPLLGPVDLAEGGHGPMFVTDLQNGKRTGIHWVITGGESGPHARPGHPDWYRSLRDQCQAAGVAFHFKQWGEWAPLNRNAPLYVNGAEIRDDARIVEFRVGKKSAGRILDGRTWDEFPESTALVSA